MNIKQASNGKYYLCWGDRKCSKIVRYNALFKSYIGCVGGHKNRIYFPKEFVGKRIRFCLEVEEDKKDGEVKKCQI